MTKLEPYTYPILLYHAHPHMPPLLPTQAECSEREGDLTGSYKKLNVVAALNFVVFFGGFLLPLGGVVTVIVMKCVK